MSITSPAVPAVVRKDQSDISERVTKLTEPVNDLELTAIDSFAGLKRLGPGERRHAINAYWRKINHVSVGETIVNVLLFTIIMWIMAFLMSLGLLVLWK